MRLLSRTPLPQARFVFHGDSLFLRQTVPRAEIRAVLMILRAWDGSHDLEVVTYATYTVCGMVHIRRRKHNRGPNRDIWKLLYEELDKKAGGVILTITKVKSHIDGAQAYCRETPAWHVLLNDLVDYAADRNSDHYGPCGKEKKRTGDATALLCRVGKIIAVLEASLRGHSTDLPLVATDVINSCEAEGERRRADIFAKADEKIIRSLRSLGTPLICTRTLTPDRARNAGGGYTEAIHYWKASASGVE